VSLSLFIHPELYLFDAASKWSTWLIEVHPTGKGIKSQGHILETILKEALNVRNGSSKERDEESWLQPFSKT